ncbi:MAG TPA: peptidoglycan editing factor PgeF [Bryobacteraceae bacterium]|nr:peptidoglycan editing factor PgeF [Bryobacteraceae bacterium]
MFYKDEGQIYRVEELERLSWLDHGFGTRLAGSWTPRPPVWVRQIHSARCVSADGAAGCLGEADCLVTNTAGRYLTIRTADCMPVLLVDESRRAVAAVHAGWRGTAQAIAAAAVQSLGERFGSRPQDLLAAIGPGICASCYEVGPEVASQFGLTGRAKLDLAGINRSQLIAAGLDPSRIFANAPCTSCRPGEFHSWRRDHVKTGRMVSAVAIRG